LPLCRLNPHSALVVAKRANALLKLKRPNAAIRDCNFAIKMNPDSAKGMLAVSIYLRH